MRSSPKYSQRWAIIYVKVGLANHFHQSAVAKSRCNQWAEGLVGLYYAIYTNTAFSWNDSYQTGCANL
jgi:hypothetical protein